MKEGWEIKQWKDVLEIRSGRSQKQVEDPNGKYPILGSSGKVMGYTDSYICEEGTTIVGRKGSINNPMMIESKFWNVDTAFGLHALNELDNKYLYYFCLGFDFTKMDRGSGRPSLVKSDLLKISIPIPPLSEQKAIVRILDQAFAAIEQAQANIQRNIENAEELFQSKLEEIFSQREEGWEERRISDLVSDAVLSKPMDGNHGNIHPKKSDFKESGVPFIMASHLVNGEVNQATCNFISEKQAATLKKGFAKDGDVLLSHKGTIGRVAILYTNLDYVVLTPQVTYYRILKKDQIFNKYLYYYFRSPIFQSPMIQIAGIGSTRAYIGITKQQELIIRFPTNLENQKEIAFDLDALNIHSSLLIKKYKLKLEFLDDLKKSLLQKAFAGELTEKEIPA